MVDWVCGSLGGSLIPQLHLTTLLRRLWLQMTSFSQDGNGHTEMYSLHFSIVEGSGDASSIFFYSLWVGHTQQSVSSHMSGTGNNEV